MTIRLIALDLDDTLLGRDLEISPANRTALNAAQDGGCTVVLASGRPEEGMLRHARHLGLAERGGWVLSYNGGRVRLAAGGEALIDQSLSAEEAREIWALAERENLDFQTYFDGAIQARRDNPYARVEAQLTGLPLAFDEGLLVRLDRPVPKIILTGDPERLAEVCPRLQERLGGRWAITLSKPFFLEFTAQGIDKGASLARLCARLGVPRQEVLACGDGYNDMSMIRWAGVGVAMANAPEAVRAAADWVAPHHAEDGVARALERWLDSCQSPATPPTIPA